MKFSIAQTRATAPHAVSGATVTAALEMLTCNPHVAHQGHHHGEIGLIARHIGRPIDRHHDVGMWEWRVR